VLRYAGLSAVGLLGWQSIERATAMARLSGADRRFTGARESGSFTGNGFPRTNWFTDPIPTIAADAWSLRIHGAVERVQTLSHAEFTALPPSTVRATLDCTGGWFTTQDWSGVMLTRVLKSASPRDNARSIVVHSATGYTRRFPIAEAERLLLATHVGGEPLSRGHGSPVRIVAPDYRGFHWVKWVVAIEVSADPEWWQSPLPLQ
jgi:DMSO/TMAO reductase YedYZ molybdopterin-dependent catalytic subunit